MRLIIGDNPFFGVNHKFGSKPLEDESIRFANAALIVAEAATNDFSTFMLSAHPGYQKLLAGAETVLSTINAEIDLALVIPYPHSLNKLVAEGGYYALVRAIGYKSLASSLFELIDCFRSENSRGLVTPFKKIIQLEIKSINADRIKPKYICLHNIVTDILLATGRHDLLNGFALASIESGLKPVFISQNPINLLSCKALAPYAACFTYNLLGYMVNPGIQRVNEFLDTIAGRKGELWAMQLLASGALSVENSLAPNVMNHFQGIVYATTKKSRIIEFSSKIKDLAK